jgi:hypothetical protein
MEEARMPWNSIHDEMHFTLSVDDVTTIVVTEGYEGRLESRRQIGDSAHARKGEEDTAERALAHLLNHLLHNEAGKTLPLKIRMRDGTTKLVGIIPGRIGHGRPGHDPLIVLDDDLEITLVSEELFDIGH